MRQERLVFPFSAIVGQEQIKKALVLNAINNKIGGVLIRGEKGTAKSLAVRGLATLLPHIKTVAGCPFSCDPEAGTALCDRCKAKTAEGQELETRTRRVSVVELPVGATEDRVVGTIDIERAIKSGEKHFDPGLLASANRGILYVDEVNLLDDHLVDVLLDAAAMGVNVVEREGVSFSHPAGFILVGTMNPEEGDLRPQLLDRFGLAVDVTGIHDKEARKEIVRRRVAFEADPPGFSNAWEAEQQQIRDAIWKAKQLLPHVTLREDLLDLIAQICEDFGVDGHRADIVIYKAATTLAAYHGRTEVSIDDVKEAAELALLHRRRRQPFEDPGMDQQRLDQSLKEWDEQSRPPVDGRSQENTPQENESPENTQRPFDEPSSSEQPEGGGGQQVFDPDEPYHVVALPGTLLDQMARSGSGRRSMSRTESKAGRYVGSAVPQGKVTDLALDATLRAAAPLQARRRGDSAVQSAVVLEKHDLRQKIREKKVGNLIMFCLDTSGSMGVRERMTATKGAILSLLIDAYQRRDRVGLVAFRGDGADLLLPPTGSAEMAQRHLDGVPTGGRTPLAHGLVLAMETLKNCLAIDKRALPLLVLVSDGRANVSYQGAEPVAGAEQVARQIKAARIKSIAIDTERDVVSFGLVRQICDEMGGTYLRLEELRAEPIISAVRTETYRNKGDLQS
ncbi:MAG: putative cobaltochelatase [Thermoleophilia bacterium]|nr:putative cobaltochelatase [Thermoleophilia bacterium]